MPTRFVCEGFVSTHASTMRDAALVFATRLAKKQFGPRGSCHQLIADHGSTKARSYRAEIGKGDNRRNVWLFVKAA